MRNEEFQQGNAGIGLPTSPLSAQKKNPGHAWHPGRERLLWIREVSRRTLLAEGRIYPAQKHEEKAEEPLRGLQALALPLLIEERFWSW